MGDRRYRQYYELLDGGAIRDKVRALSDEELVAALAACAKRDDELRANVIATELHNRSQARIRSEAALFAAEERYRVLVEESPYGLFLVSLDGRVMYASPANERIMGWRPDEMQGQHASTLVVPEDLERVRARREAIVAQGSEASLTFRSARRPGVPLLARIRPFDLGTGQAIGTVTVVREADEP